MRWSETVTLEFVKIYLRHDCLWNPSHPGYKLKHQREKAYNDISAEFENATTKTLSVLEVKLKIKNLRTTYMQMVHKVLEKSSPDSIYEPSLIWFNEMDNCLKHLSTNRYSSSYNHSQENPEVDSSSQIWVNQQIPNQSIEDINPDPLIPHTDEENEVSKEETTKSRIKREMRSSPLHYKRIKKKKSKTRNSTDYFTDSNSESAVKNQNSKAKEDEFDIYGKYIASQLRRMELRKALRLQLEFQTLVSEARISEISD